MISDKLKEKYIDVDLEKEYQETFKESAPYYDMGNGHRPIEEWEEIMIKALEEGESYEEEISSDPDVLY